jgi:hypothetical protein
MSELIQAAEDRRDIAELTLGQTAAEVARSPERGPRSPQPAAAPSPEEVRSGANRLELRFRAYPERLHAMRPSYRAANRNLRAALLELEQLLPSLRPEDVERLLDFARRLAR